MTVSEFSGHGGSTARSPLVFGVAVTMWTIEAKEKRATVIPGGPQNSPTVHRQLVRGWDEIEQEAPRSRQRWRSRESLHGFTLFSFFWWNVAAVTVAIRG